MNVPVPTIVLAALSLMASPCLSKPGSQWTGTWANSPRAPLPEEDLKRAIAAYPTWVPPTATELNGTIRYRLRVTKGGQMVRLTFFNPYPSSFKIGAAAVAVAAEGMTASDGTSTRVTFGGEQGSLIPPDAPLQSDAVPLQVADGAEVLVSLFVEKPLRLWSDPSSPLPPAALAAGSDQTMVPSLKVTSVLPHRPLVSRIDVTSDIVPRAIVALGDSITDGERWSGGDRAWPETLARRLASRNISVLNAGIGANRLLQPGGQEQPAALARLDRDVFSVPGLSHVILLEGINDIALGGGVFPLFSADAQPAVSGREIIAAYAQIAARAHDRRVKVIGATLLPFGGSDFHSRDKESIRQQVNAWLRSNRILDGLIDFDRALRDPKAPDRLHPEFDSGDHLHPNAAGHRAMGDTVPLDLFGDVVPAMGEEGSAQ